MIAAMPSRRSNSTLPRRSPASPRAHAPRNRPGASQWLPIIKLKVSVLTTTMPVAALSPPRNANSASPVCDCDNGSASTYRSEGTPCPASSASPARASGSTGNAIRTRYSGNNQRAVRTWRSSRHSTTPTWNWCGRVNIASTPSNTSGMKPPLSVDAAASGNDGGDGNPRPSQTNRPSASMATSLNSDSNAIASTSPRLCSAALARRVPNSIANRPITNATYSELSRHGGWSAPACESVSRAKLIDTAFSCRATYGIRPSTAINVTPAASHASLPRRVAIRSAIEVALLARASFTSCSISPAPSAYSSRVPTKVGGSGQS
jgi:hypothetical protein